MSQSRDVPSVFKSVYVIRRLRKQVVFSGTLRKCFYSVNSSMPALISSTTEIKFYIFTGSYSVMSCCFLVRSATFCPTCSQVGRLLWSKTQQASMRDFLSQNIHDVFIFSKYIIYSSSFLTYRFVQRFGHCGFCPFRTCSPTSFKSISSYGHFP